MILKYRKILVRDLLCHPDNRCASALANTSSKPTAKDVHMVEDGVVWENVHTPEEMEKKSPEALFTGDNIAAGNVAADGGALEKERPCVPSQDNVVAGKRVVKNPMASSVKIVKKRKDPPPNIAKQIHALVRSSCSRYKR